MAHDLTLWVGLVVLGASVLMLCLVMLFRLRLVYRTRREAAFVALWRPLMLGAVEGLAVSLPKVSRADRYSFLMLWNHLHESMRGEAEENLGELCRRAGMDKVARQMLRERGVKRRLVGAITVANLRDQQAWSLLQPLAEGSHPLISIVAARALLLIDPKVAVEWLMPLLSSRGDWARGRVMAMLRETDAEILSPILATATATANANDAHLPRLLGFLDVVHHEHAFPVIRGLLAHHTEPEVLAACLRLLQDPKDLPTARKMAGHASAVVRLEAARALGRLGTDADQAQLVGMMSDFDWWVRYRTAEALFALPQANWNSIKGTRDKLQDRSAIATIDQVLAERSPA